MDCFYCVMTPCYQCYGGTKYLHLQGRRMVKQMSDYTEKISVGATNPHSWDIARAKHDCKVEQVQSMSQLWSSEGDPEHHPGNSFKETGLKHQVLIAYTFFYHPSQHNNYQNLIHMRLSVYWWYSLLHVSTHRAIIRQYTLITISQTIELCSTRIHIYYMLQCYDHLQHTWIVHSQHPVKNGIIFANIAELECGFAQ
jgi:hypothetical protein